MSFALLPSVGLCRARDPFMDGQTHNHYWDWVYGVHVVTDWFLPYISFWWQFTRSTQKVSYLWL